MEAPSVELFDKKRLDNGQSGAWIWRLWSLGRDAAPTGTTKG